MRRVKGALSVIAACTILAGGCGDRESNSADYCDALRDLMSAAPDYGQTGSELDTEIAAYVTALERAAADAPTDQKAALQNFAAAFRQAQADPTAEGVSDRIGDALGGMLIVQEHAESECGLDFGATTD